jgi:Ca-activated chloride channel family protein
MRASITAFLCASAFVAALAGTAIAQDQGPLNTGSGTVAKKKPADNSDPASNSGGDLPKIPSEYTKKDKIDTTNLQTFKTEVEQVTVDVAIMDNKGHFIPGIDKGYFRVLEDNVPQQVTSFNATGQAPMTVAVLIEFSNKFQHLYGPTWAQTLQLAWGFASTLRPEDYCALISYDIKPEILTDFTTNRMQIQEGLRQLTIPQWSEANLFDALTDTADRMQGIEGRKAILVITSGIDTFSKITYDKTRKMLQEAGVPIYSIGLLQTLQLMYGARATGVSDIDLLQADNELKTFATETGGQSYLPRFMGEWGGIFQQIEQQLRDQYVLTYAPSNKTHDGSYRKIKVQLVDHDGNPMALKDDKGKPMKYTVVAKAGYKAPRAVE